MSEEKVIDASTQATIAKLDHLQRLDHDTLIRVEVAVGDIRMDIKELKDGVKDTINNHETRLLKLEKAVTDERVKAFDDLLLWQRDFNTRWKFVVAIAGVVGSLTGFIATFLSLMALAGGSK